RGGDFSALVALLDADVTLTADAAASPAGRPVTLHGVDAVARGAVLASGRAGESRLALVDGAVGIVFAPAGHLRVVLILTVSEARKITAMDVIGDPDRLPRLSLARLPEGRGHAGLGGAAAARGGYGVGGRARAAVGQCL